MVNTLLRPLLVPTLRDYLTGVGTLYRFFRFNPLFKHIFSFLFFQVFGPFERTKYYAIWTLTEGASILTGLGFTGFSSSGSPTWNGAANVQVKQIELPPNFKVLLDSWNMKTNVWLRECIYKRVAPKGRKPGNRVTMITFLTSALWVSFLFIILYEAVF